jgi:D-glycero-D-manno-heptose 1,7-bisphosphate phosphatase
MQRISKYNLNIAYFNESIDYLKTHKCIFLDRDGVIIEDVGYISNINKIKFLNGVFETLSYFKKQGYLIGIITNQSGIARGFFTELEFITLQTKINKLLSDQGIEIDFVIACPYLKGGKPPYDINHEFRKPLPGMINEACRRIKIDKQDSFLVGDRMSDIESAMSAGLGKSFLIKNKSLYSEDLDSLISDKFQIEQINVISEIIDRFKT